MTNKLPYQLNNRWKCCGKNVLEKFLDTHEEELLPEGVSFDTSMLNVEEKSILAFVLAVFDEVFQQTLSPRPKRKAMSIIYQLQTILLIGNRPYRVSPAERFTNSSDA
jgi:hypothetical protein